MNNFLVAWAKRVEGQELSHLFWSIIFGMILVLDLFFPTLGLGWRALDAVILLYSSTSLSIANGQRLRREKQNIELRAS